MADKLDFKKAYKDLYMPGTAPALVRVPAMRFIQVDGMGAPEGESYQEAVQLLYTLSFTIKMSRLSGQAPAGYVEYVVPPLEGLWEGDPTNPADDRTQWRWTSLIRQPDFVTEAVFDWACEEAQRKKDIDPSRARYAEFEEGLCAQVMHIGPYRTEPETMARLRAFIEEQGYRDDCGPVRRHHEIYLSDPRRTAADKLRTVLRHPVA